MTAEPDHRTPPLDGWAVSAKANERRVGTAAFSIDPAPTIVIRLSDSAVVPAAAGDGESTRGGVP